MEKPWLISSSRPSHWRCREWIASHQTLGAPAIISPNLSTPFFFLILFFPPYFSFFTFWKSVLPTTIRLLSALIVSTFDSHKDGWYLRSPASKTEAEVSHSWAAGLLLPDSDDVNWTRSARSGDRGRLVRHSEIMGSGCKYLALYAWTSQAGEV